MTVLDASIPTCLEKTETVFKIIESFATTIAIIVGGIWAYFRFRRQRENHALIDFSVDIVFHSKHKDWWIVEIIAYIENKGKVQHKIDLFEFELASLSSSDNIEITEEFGGQVHFPNIITRRSFLPKKYRYFFVEPGLKNKYSFISRIPADTEVLILHSWFNYLDGKHSHSAEVTKKVPS